MTQEQNSSSVENLERLANRHWDDGNFQAAAEVFLKIKQTSPLNPSLLKFMGTVALQNQNFSDASQCFTHLTEVCPNDVDAWFGLGVAKFSGGDLDAAMAAFERAITLNPSHFPAHLQIGYIAETREQQALALQHFLAGIRLAPNPKQMPENHALSALLRHARGFVGQQLDLEVSKTFSAIEEKYAGSDISRIRDCADIFLGKKTVQRAHPKLKPGLFYIPGLEPKMFFETEQLPLLRLLEEGAEVIRNELKGLLASRDVFQPYINHPVDSSEASTWSELNRSRDWSTFHLFRHGEKILENCLLCPETTRIIEQMDLTRIPGYGPEVMFSVLAPNTKIKAHHGPASGRVIVHLPLIVPQDCGAIRVGTQERNWEEGKVLAFDDAFEHEAWNNSDQQRVVLIVDIWNPALTDAEREAFTQLHIIAQQFETQASSHA